MQALVDPIAATGLARCIRHKPSVVDKEEAVTA
jgi:hypothetical protein